MISKPASQSPTGLLTHAGGRDLALNVSRPSRASATRLPRRRAMREFGAGVGRQAREDKGGNGGDRRDEEERRREVRGRDGRGGLAPPRGFDGRAAERHAGR